MNLVKLSNAIRYLVLLNVVLAVPAMVLSASEVGVTTSTLCGVVNGVRTVIGVLALLLFIIGGALYALAHLLPAAGNIRGNLQGWSLGMILGGIVGLILVILAPIILGFVLGFGGITTTNVTC